MLFQSDNMLTKCCHACFIEIKGNSIGQEKNLAIQLFVLYIAYMHDYLNNNNNLSVLYAVLCSLQ